MSEDFLGCSEAKQRSSPWHRMKLCSKKDLMYVLKSGSLQILDDNYIYEPVSAGGIVGEMAI
jgi:hypothetical protein